MTSGVDDARVVPNVVLPGRYMNDDYITAVFAFMEMGNIQ